MDLLTRENPATTNSILGLKGGVERARIFDPGEATLR